MEFTSKSTRKVVTLAIEQLTTGQFEAYTQGRNPGTRRTYASCHSAPRRSTVAILATFLRYLNNLSQPAPAAISIASDLRLIAAAQAEGLHTLNPELICP